MYLLQTVSLLRLPEEKEGDAEDGAGQKTEWNSGTIYYNIV